MEDVAGILLKLKNKIKKDEDELRRMEGKLSILRKRLLKEFGCDSLEIAKKKLLITNDEHEKKNKVIKESRNYSLLEIDLLTGRKNQIRVHLAEKGCPVAGDKIYGEKERGIKRLTLHAASVTITHPHTKEKMTFKTDVPVYFESLVKWKGKEHGATKR